MRYEFITDDGELVEHEMPATEAPDIGARVTLPDGRRVTRVLSRPAAVAGDPWKPYISNRLPRHLKGVPCTAEGKPIITSRAQERNIMAKFGYERE